MENVYSEALRLALLKRRTKKEVVEKLIDKGFESSLAEEAADYYMEAGYIDHRDYAKRYTHDSVKIKGYGKERIKLELKRKGIEDEIIDAALSDIEFDLESLMKKRFPSCSDEKQMNKIFNFYYRRGFTPEEIKNASKNLYSEGLDYD